MKATRSLVVGLLALGTISIGAAATWSDADAEEAAAVLGEEEGEPGVVPAPADSPLATLMIRLGLDAPALTAAGVTSGTVASVVSAVESELAQEPDAVADADAAFASARIAEDNLRRKIQSGRASSEEVASYPSIKAALESAEAARDAVLDGLFDAGCGVLTGPQSTLLAKVRDTRSTLSFRSLPVQYLCADLSEAELVDLRDALDGQKYWQSKGESVPQETQDALSPFTQDEDASAAKLKLDTYLASVQSAWNTAVE